MFNKLYTTGRMLEALNRYRDGSDLVCHERIDAKIADAFLRILRVGIDLGGDHDADPALYKAQRSDNVAAH